MNYLERDDFIDFLKSNGFGDIINHIKDIENIEDRNPKHKKYMVCDDYEFLSDRSIPRYFYVNTESQSEIDKKIKRGPNDYIKSCNVYYIKDFINTEHCKALVLVEYEEHREKKLVKALIKNNEGKDILWTPVIEGLILGLNTGSLNYKKYIYMLLRYICDNLIKDDNKGIRVSSIFNEIYGSLEIPQNIDFKKDKCFDTKTKSILDIRLYFSVVKETMILEEARYPNTDQYGKRMFHVAYNDLAINNTPYDKWRKTWFFYKEEEVTVFYDTDKNKVLMENNGYFYFE